MPHIMYAVLGIASGVANTIGFVPYLRDIFRHKTKPERAMWWIYLALFALLFAAQASAGASWLLIATGAYIFAAGFIAVLSLKYGYGTFHKRDALSLGVAALGLIAWLLVDKPIIAILMVIVIDFAGFWLTLIKTWHAPYSETLVSWQLACLSAVLSVFAAGSWKPAIILYPIYAVVGSGLLVWLIIYRRRLVKEDQPDF